MLFKFLLGEGSERLERVEGKVQEMFALDRREFDLAMSALLGDVDAAGVNAELRAMDHKVNTLERELRRDLVVHTSVYGAIDTPAVLIYMSIVKDIERIGDYAKNLLDLARDGANLSETPEGTAWRDLAAEISGYIERAASAFRTRDEEASRQVLARCGELMASFDRRVSALVRGESGDTQAVARALTYRYLKRVVAHLTNTLSAVVMPVDKIDYFDEDPEDR
jgi:phosphate transport system protein